MRLGIAGVGRIGAFHATTLTGVESVDELLIADADPLRAGEVAARLGATAAGSVEALLTSGAAGRIDGLVVAAATSAHAELVAAAVQAGIPVLCEKPVAEDLPAARGLLAAANEAGATVVIGFQRRFDTGFLAARAAVASGELGWLHTVRASTLDVAPPPAAYVAVSGGLFRDCAVHDIDSTRWVLGREVVSVYARGTNRGAAYFTEYDDVDSASALLTFDDGTVATLSATRYNSFGHDIRLELAGSRASVAVGLDERTPLRSLEPGATFPTGTPYPDFFERFAPAYRAELAAFADLVSDPGAGSGHCTLGDAVAAMEVAEALDRSRHEDRAVDLAEVRS